MLTVQPLALAGLLLAAGACSNFEPSGEQAFTPPAQYLAWWSKTETCAGLRGDFDAVRWFVVPGAAFECPTGQCVGRWESNGRIFVAAAYKYDEMVVRHEMLHSLIGRPGHPDPPFGRGCGLTWQTWTSSGGRTATSPTID